MMLDYMGVRMKAHPWEITFGCVLDSQVSYIGYIVKQADFHAEGPFEDGPKAGRCLIQARLPWTGGFLSFKIPFPTFQLSL